MRRSTSLSIGIMKLNDSFFLLHFKRANLILFRKGSSLDPDESIDHGFDTVHHACLQKLRGCGNNTQSVGNFGGLNVDPVMSEGIDV